MFLMCFVFQSVSAQSLFLEKAAELNIDHSYNSSTAGGRISCIDFNQDGLDDLTFATAEGEGILFYLNSGANNFTQVDLGIENLQLHKQILWVDFDNDLDLDLFVASFDGVNRLYQNQGNLEYVDITIEAGLPSDSLKTIGANFSDYNRDGYLDLFFNTRAIFGSPQGHQNFLFKNNGDGTFCDVTLEANIPDFGRPNFCSVFADFDNDIWPDIYLANDRSSRNTLFSNVGSFFVDASELAEADLEIEAMSTTLGDYNRDGYLDLYISNNREGNKLLKNISQESLFDTPLFEEVAEDLDVEVNGFCWGALFFDVNNNGLLDLYASSSLLGKDSINSTLFLQESDSHFEEFKIGFEVDTVRSYCNAFGDFNEDGFLDFVVTNRSPHKSHVWINQQEGHNWIKIKLKGIKSNADGIGSRVEIYQDSNYQQIFTSCAYGYLGQNSNKLHFGFGEKTILDSIKITWPTGHIDQFDSIGINQTLEIFEGQSTDTIFVDSDIELLDDQEVQDTTMTSSFIIQENDSILKVIPNPFIEEIQILDISPNAIVEVWTLSGELITVTKHSNKINLGNLASGTYILKVIENDFFKTVSIVKI